MYYECQHFKIQELVDPEIYKKRGDKAWELLDSRLLETIDIMREYYYDQYNASMIINNWLWGGERKWSGFRTPSSFYYSPTSQHSHGRAVDFLLQDRKTKNFIDTQMLRDEIIHNQETYEFSGITTLENFSGMNWVHIDCRMHDRDKYGIKIVTG